MTVNDLQEFYSNRPQDSIEAITGIIEMFADWDTGHLAALMLDVSMILATQRGRPGGEAILRVLTSMDELITNSPQYKRTMN